MNDTTLDKQIWVRVDGNTHAKMKEKCERDKIKMSALIRMLIAKYLEGDITL